MENLESIKKEVSQKFEVLEKALKNMILSNKELIDEAKTEYVKTNHLDSKYDVRYWKDEVLYRVISEILDGMMYFFEEISVGNSFPIGNLNNVKKVYAGLDKILFINKKSISRFSPEIKYFVNGHLEIEN